MQTMWKKLNQVENKYLKQDQINDLQDEILMIYKSYGNDSETSSKTNVARFHRYITNNYDYLSDYGKYEAKKYLKRIKISNNEILEFMIYIAYCKKQYKMNQVENEIVEELVEDTYTTEVNKIAKETGRKPKTIDYLLLGLGIMKLTNARGYIWKDYKDSITMYNANETYRYLITNKEKGLEDLLIKQKNRMLKKKKNPTEDDKYSGALEDQLVFLVNKVKIKAYEDMGIVKVRFIGVHDKNQTEMCRTLEGQEFYINKMNEYRRYSDSAKGIMTYKTFGLKVGENLPPINNYFHYCRSSITYQV